MSLISQTVRMESCLVETGPCRLLPPCYSSSCTQVRMRMMSYYPFVVLIMLKNMDCNFAENPQVHSFHRLLAFNPCQPSDGLFLDTFRLPSACSCRLSWKNYIFNNSHKLFPLSWSQCLHIEQSHFFEHLILAVEDLLLHLLPLSDHLQGVAVPVRHEVDPGVDGLKVDAHLHIPDHDRLLACVQLLKHLVRLLSCDRPKHYQKM